MKRLIALLILCAPLLAHAQIQFKNFPIGSTISGGDYTWCDQSGTSNRCPFSSIFASPLPIGVTAPNSASFTTLNLSGALTTNVLGLTQCLHVNTAGIVSGTGVDCGAGGGSSAFNAITSGINTSALMQVGSGSVLQPNGSGTITANAFTGLLSPSNGGTGASSLLSANIAVFSGAITSGHCTQWSATGIIVDSGGTCGSGGSNAFSAITSSTNTGAAMVVGTGASLGFTGAGTIAATSVSGFSPASGKTLTINNSITFGGTDSTTFTLPATSGTVDTLNSAQTITALKTFTNSDLCLLGSSTGCTTFTSANSSASAFALTFPAVTDTVVTLAASQTLTNKSIAASEVNTGTLNCSQLPALTGSVTTSAGSCATSSGQSQNNQTTSYTMVLGDAGAVIYMNCASACTLTIPANSSVAYTVPTHMDIYVDPASAVVTLAITTDTLTLSPTNTTGSRSLAAGATVKINKYATTKWNTTGTGET